MLSAETKARLMTFTEKKQTKQTYEVSTSGILLEFCSVFLVLHGYRLLKNSLSQAHCTDSN